jgi:hypothetical protein
MPARDGSDSVDAYMAALEHTRKDEIAVLRERILKSDPGISEHVKWNAPSFRYSGDDRITFRLHPKNRVQLVFHMGARRSENAFTFEDTSGLLEWVAADRAVVNFADAVAVTRSEGILETLVRRWVHATAR